MFHNASIRFGIAAALVLILAGCAGAGPTTQSANPSVAADGTTSPTTPGGASDGSPPDGSWQVELTADDLVAVRLAGRCHRAGHIHVDIREHSGAHRP